MIDELEDFGLDDLEGYALNRQHKREIEMEHADPNDPNSVLWEHSSQAPECEKEDEDEDTKPTDEDWVALWEGLPEYEDEEEKVYNEGDCYD